MLSGTEVKSLRGGKATISESYAGEKNGEIFLVNAYIPNTCRPTSSITRPSGRGSCLPAQEPGQQADRAVQKEGLTIVPLKIYFNDRGRAKVEIALARGKKLHDKRETEKERDWSRERGRLLRDKG